MMTTLIALALIAQQQTVTFTHPGAHSSVVLAALGQELNLTLRPSGSVNKDYFLVHFKKVSIEEAFDKIAETLNATWTKKNDVYYLGRTRQQDMQDEAKEDEPLLRAHRMFVEKTLVSGGWVPCREDPRDGVPDPALMCWALASPQGSVSESTGS